MKIAMKKCQEFFATNKFTEFVSKLSLKKTNKNLQNSQKMPDDQDDHLQRYYENEFRR